MTQVLNDTSLKELSIKDLRLPHNDVANLKRFFGITRDDEKRLQSIAGIVDKSAAPLIEQLYKNVMAEPETRKQFLDVDSLEGVKRREVQELQRMTCGVYNTGYIESRLAMGLQQSHSGMAPKWYVGAESYLLSNLANEIKGALGKDEGAFDSYAALTKFFLLDIAMTMECAEITRQQQLSKSSQQVEEAEGTLRLMLDAASTVAIYGITAEGEIHTWNKGAENLLGYTQEDVKKVNFRVFYDDAASINARLQKVFSAGVMEHDCWMIRADGTKFFARVSTAVMLNEDFKVKGYVEIVQDQTVSMLANRKLEQQRNDIANLIGVLSEVTSQITQVASALSSATANAVAAIAETTATSDQVRQTAEQTNIKAKAVSEDAKAVLQASRQGREATDGTIKGMAHIRQQMESIADCMSQLTNQSKQIGVIIASVDDLAQQSNLLAVNASIEAAKAGEQGKGFAVVAQEVKNLSQQSKSATAHVRRILNDVVRATTEATEATQQGTRAVEQGQQQAIGAGDVIRTLTMSMDNAAEATELIEVSSQQQVAGMKQLVQAMESIKELSENNLLSAKNLDAASKQLSDLGSKLLDLTSETLSETGQSNGHK